MQSVENKNPVWKFVDLVMVWQSEVRRVKWSQFVMMYCYVYFCKDVLSVSYRRRDVFRVVMIYFPFYHCICFRLFPSYFLLFFSFFCNEYFVVKVSLSFLSFMLIFFLRFVLLYVIFSFLFAQRGIFFFCSIFHYLFIIFFS